MKISAKLLLIFGVFLVFAATIYSPHVFAQTAFDAFDDKKSPKVSDQAEEPIQATADSLEYMKDERKIVAKGNVVVTYQENKLTSDYAEIYTDTKKAYAKGHVIIYQQGGVLRGEKVYYDFRTHQGSFPQGSAIQAPWYGYADQMDQLNKDKVQLYNARLSTCPLDEGEPHYEMVAKRAIIYPGKRIIAYDVKYKILGKTVFWLPYVDLPLDWLRDMPFVVQTGYSKQWGLYMKTSKTFSLTDNISFRGHLDWYEKRGVGGGGDVFYSFDSIKTTGFVKMYYIEDQEAPANSSVQSDGTDNPYAERSERKRYRLTWKHRTDFDDYTNVFANFYKLSDAHILQDFFEDEYREEIEPKTFVTFTRNTERSGFFVNTDVRTNKFFDDTQELPQMRFDWNNQRLGNSKIFYKNSMGLANFQKRFAMENKEENSWRFDMPHTFSMPLKVGAVQILPEIGFRETYYTDTPTGEEKSRFAGEAGIDLKTQVSKIYDWSGNILGMEFNKIRHLVEPSIGYHDRETFGVKRKDLYMFDPVDTKNTLHQLVIGLENRIQTKRKYKNELKRVDVVSFNSYVFFNANSDLPTIEETTGFTNWRNDVTFRPYDWLVVEWLSDINLINGGFNASNTDVVLTYKDKFSILLGHRYIPTDTNVDGSSQLVVDAEYKLNSRWSIGGYARTEFDTGSVEEWELRLIRNLSCGWFLDFGYNVRNSEIDNNNYTVYARLTLVPLDLKMQTGPLASFADPRIGDRIAGGNSNHFSRNILGQFRTEDYKDVY